MQCFTQHRGRTMPLMRRDVDIETVPEWFRATVHGEMLGCRNHLEVLRIVALHPGHERDGQASGQKRIFAVRLHAAPPARIAEDVDIR